MRFHLRAGQTVDIPETDLRKAPNSLLSIAAQQPHEASISVPSWPGASHQMLQVVAGCYTGTRPPIVQGQFPEVLIALDFFHIPEKLWPTAVKVLPSVKASYDEATATAHRLVNDILEGSFEGASLDDAGVLKKGKYALCRSDAGVLKLQHSNSEEEFFSTENKMVIDSMLSAVLHNVAATNGLKLDICCIDGLPMTHIKVQVFAVAD